MTIIAIYIFIGTSWLFLAHLIPKVLSTF